MYMGSGKRTECEKGGPTRVRTAVHMWGWCDGNVTRRRRSDDAQQARFCFSIGGVSMHGEQRERVDLNWMER